MGTVTGNPLKAPKGIQSLFEPLMLFVIDDIVKPAIGEKKYEPFLPYLLTLFFFIWINNMLGLIPIFQWEQMLPGISLLPPVWR
jgi:F-type H+-transporting ATPase subunit a